MPLQQQQLLYNGREMKNNDKLSALGVKDEDLVMMVSNSAAIRYLHFFFVLFYQLNCLLGFDLSCFFLEFWNLSRSFVVW